jgi:CubicO group peptidase (beta-lactamase class C family)
MLLSHTSGYQDFWPQDYVMPGMLKPTTPQAIADAWAKKPLDFEPGSRWQYSNTNYTLAGMVVEKAAGIPMWQFVKSRILDPVGLTTAKDFDVNPRASDATGYVRYGLGPLRPAPDAGPGWGYAAFELAMTASDLAKWDVCVIRRCGILTPTSWAEFEREIVLNNGAGTGYSLGLDVGMQGGRFMLEHSGEVSGFVAENIVFPEDSAAIVVLSSPRRARMLCPSATKSSPCTPAWSIGPSASALIRTRTGPSRSGSSSWMARTSAYAAATAAW